MKKDSKVVHQFARDLGYVLTPTGSGHVKAVHPNGAVVILAATVGKGNGVKRERHRLKKGAANEPNRHE